MNDLTKRQKIDALLKAMPHMTYSEACKLLGFDEYDADLVDESETFTNLKNLFGLR